MAESCLQATIWHLLIITLGSASPGNMGYPRFTFWSSDRCHLPYWTPSLFLVLLKEKFYFSELFEICLGKYLPLINCAVYWERHKAESLRAIVWAPTWKWLKDATARSFTFGLAAGFKWFLLRVILTTFLLTVIVGKCSWRPPSLEMERWLFYCWLLCYLLVNFTCLHHSCRLPNLLFLGFLWMLKISLLNFGGGIFSLSPV